LVGFTLLQAVKSARWIDHLIVVLITAIGLSVYHVNLHVIGIRHDEKILFICNMEGLLYLTGSYLIRGTITTMMKASVNRSRY